MGSFVWSIRLYRRTAFVDSLKGKHCAEYWRVLTIFWEWIWFKILKYLELLAWNSIQTFFSHFLPFFPEKWSSCVIFDSEHIICGASSNVKHGIVFVLYTLTVSSTAWETWLVGGCAIRFWFWLNQRWAVLCPLWWTEMIKSRIQGFMSYFLGQLSVHEIRRFTDSCVQFSLPFTQLVSVNEKGWSTQMLLDAYFFQGTKSPPNSGLKMQMKTSFDQNSDSFLAAHVWVL